MTRKISYRRKRLGQVFLRDRSVVEGIMRCAALAGGETVLEIGPGRGILTTALASQAACLYALEIDPRYVQAMRQLFAEAPHVHILQADARSYDYETLPKPLVVVANLPYQAGMAILTQLFRSRQRLSRLVVMLQKEVAGRLLAAPDSSSYSALSVFFQYYAAVQHGFHVSRQAFTPVPAVDSSVITLTPYRELPWPQHDEQFFFRVVRQAFSHRRKLLRGNLLGLAHPGLSQAIVAQAFQILGLGGNARAQELPVIRFVQLSETLRGLLPEGVPRHSTGGCSSLPSLSQRM
ncbi:MAG: 16S rRNA (adenine(1518)-N(6)/adenine(1519)-N(6))-dimethyltransferase RsmA [Candidatus Tectomicrobia bacterium]|nr:16S rRNA (adenine(1518)-N(6)/adenine(1519)-N(6))-dimethyltransferase RsmA [Candidatus Tectomicrobia bacterium]